MQTTKKGKEKNAKNKCTQFATSPELQPPFPFFWYQRECSRAAANEIKGHLYACSSHHFPRKKSPLLKHNSPFLVFFFIPQKNVYNCKLQHNYCVTRESSNFGLLFGNNWSDQCIYIINYTFLILIAICDKMSFAMINFFVKCTSLANFGKSSIALIWMHFKQNFLYVS